MRKYRSIKCGAVVVTVVVLLGLFASAQINATETQSRRLVVTGSSHSRLHGDALLVIHRIPNLGTRVIVSLWIDGEPAGPIGYGHVYQRYIAPGRHVISVLPGPAATWREPSFLTLNFRGGETYVFTAQSNHAGQVILVPGTVTGWGTPP